VKHEDINVKMNCLKVHHRYRLYGIEVMSLISSVKVAYIVCIYLVMGFSPCVMVLESLTS